MNIKLTYYLQSKLTCWIAWWEPAYKYTMFSYARLLSENTWDVEATLTSNIGSSTSNGTVNCPGLLHTVIAYYNDPIL